MRLKKIANIVIMAVWEKERTILFDALSTEAHDYLDEYGVISIAPATGRRVFRVSGIYAFKDVLGLMIDNGAAYSESFQGNDSPTTGRITPDNSSPPVLIDFPLIDL